MKKSRVRRVLILTSFVLALLIRLYAVLPSCESYWNHCQYQCQGNPVYVVYEDGKVRVECQQSKSPCPSPEWLSGYCE